MSTKWNKSSKTNSRYLGFYTQMRILCQDGNSKSEMAWREIKCKGIKLNQGGVGLVRRFGPCSKAKCACYCTKWWKESPHLLILARFLLELQQPRLPKIAQHCQQYTVMRSCHLEMLAPASLLSPFKILAPFQLQGTSYLFILSVGCGFTDLT